MSEGHYQPLRKTITESDIHVIVNLAIQQFRREEHEPMKKDIQNLLRHAYSWYGNGSGTPGKLDFMEQKQDERWEEWREFQTSIKDRLGKLEITDVHESGLTTGRSTLTTLQREWVKIVFVAGTLLLQTANAFHWIH